MTVRLKTKIWVQALLRRCAVADVPAFVARKGFEEAGSVIVKVNYLNGFSLLYRSATDGDGNRVWLAAPSADPASEETCLAYIEKQVSYDPDLWIVEIEDKNGRHFIDEPIELEM